MADDRLVQPGRFYNRTVDGKPTEQAPTNSPSVWICRRLADYPRGKIPTGGSVTECESCGVEIVYNPRRRFANNPPLHCMQCEDIDPVPL